MVFQKKLCVAINGFQVNATWGDVGAYITGMSNLFQSFFCSHQSHTSPCPNPKGFMGWITNRAETLIYSNLYRNSTIPFQGFLISLGKKGRP